MGKIVLIGAGGVNLERMLERNGWKPEDVILVNSLADDFKEQLHKAEVELKYKFKPPEIIFTRKD